MRRQTNFFVKGIDQRVTDTKGDEIRFKKLQNARLQKRGDTGSITRFSGYSELHDKLYSAGDVFLDSVFYLDYLIILYYDNIASETRVDIFNVKADPVAIETLTISTLQKDYAELTLLEDTIFISNYEKQLNRISGNWYVNDLKSTTPNISAIEGFTGGTLKQNTVYWYKVRYRYFEGHLTKTSYPVKLDTETNTTIQLTIDVEQNDLDGGFINVQIFRKEDSGNYFLIDEITPTNTTTLFVDNGKPELSLLDEENYVWADSCQTEEIVRDRLVKANNKYESVDNDTLLNAVATDTTIATGEQGAPYNTDIDLFTQVRKKDGTLTFHKFQETISTDSDDSVIQTNLTTAYGATDDPKEIATYARFRPKPSTDGIRFNSLEIYNANVPSIATSGTGDEEKAANPHIFLGWKFLRADNGVTPTYPEVYDEEWDNGTDTPSDNTDNFWIAGSSTTPLQVNSATFNSDVLNIVLYDANNATTIGQGLPYSKYAFNFPTPSGSDSVIYRLAFYDALQEAIRQGKCYVKLKALNNVSFLSNERPNEDFIDTKVKVVALKDTSLDEAQIFYNGTNQQIYPSNKNHLYLVLEPGSPFDDFTNESANNLGVLGDYAIPEVPNISHRYEFELIGLQTVDTNDFTVTSTSDWEEDVDYDYRLKLTDYSDFNNSSAVFLRKQNNTTSGTPTTPAIQGWEKTVNNKFEFFTLNSWNEYSEIVTKDDLDQYQADYTNQLIWSDSYIPESNISKVRNFDYNNFKYISPEFGSILKISYILGKLLVFCERGVNIINVGEVLTRQVSGETFVDSSSLLNDDYWALESLQNVSPRSIIKHENMLFFCDGFDVWMYDGKFTNITNGKIDIDPNISYIGAYDPSNKEYLLSDSTGTYSYSLELGEWAGKHTFKIETARQYKNNYYGVAYASDSTVKKPTKFNTGNLYGVEGFTTIIESVAQYFESPLTPKRFRKFYLDTGLLVSGNYNAYTDAYNRGYDGATSSYLYYSIDGQNFNSVQTYDKKVENGIINVGVAPQYSTGYYLYWKIETEDPTFVLRSIGQLWRINRRR